MGRRVLRVLLLLACGLALGWWFQRPKPDPRGPAHAAMERVIPTVRFRQAPLEQVLRECERVARVPIAVDWEALREAGITPATPVTLHRYDSPLGDTLQRIVGQLPDDHHVGVFVVADYDRIRLGGAHELRYRCVVRDYDLTRMLRHPSLMDELAERDRFVFGGYTQAPPPLHDPYLRRREVLLDVLTETLDPDSWLVNGGSVGDARLAGDRLLVLQTVENLHALEDLLTDFDPAKPIDSIWPGPWVEDVAWRALLARRAPTDIKLLNVPYDRALDHLRETFRVNIEHDTGFDMTRRVTLNLPRPTLEEAALKVANAIAVADESAGLAPQRGGNGIVLCAWGATRWSCTENYDLRPLIGTSGDRQTFDDFSSRMQQEVAPDTWRDNGGNLGAIRQVYKGRAVVTQSRANHHLIRQWLDARLAEAPKQGVDR